MLAITGPAANPAIRSDGHLSRGSLNGNSSLLCGPATPKQSYRVIPGILPAPPPAPGPKRVFNKDYNLDIVNGYASSSEYSYNKSLGCNIQYSSPSVNGGFTQKEHVKTNVEDDYHDVLSSRDQSISSDCSIVVNSQQPLVPLKGILKKSKSSESLNRQNIQRGKRFRFSVGNLSNQIDEDFSQPCKKEVEVQPSSPSPVNGHRVVDDSDDATYGFGNWEVRRNSFQRRFILQNKTVSQQPANLELNNNNWQNGPTYTNTKDPVSLPDIAEVPSDSQVIYNDCRKLTSKYSLDDISVLTNGAVREIKINDDLSSKLHAKKCNNMLQSFECNKHMQKPPFDSVVSNNIQKSPLKLSGIKTSLLKFPKQTNIQSESANANNKDNNLTQSNSIMTCYARESRHNVSTSVRRNLSDSMASSPVEPSSSIQSKCSLQDNTNTTHVLNAPTSDKLRRFDRPPLPTTVPGGRRRLTKNVGPVISTIMRRAAADKSGGGSDGSESLKRTIYYMSDIIDRKQNNLECVNNRKNCSSTSDLSSASQLNGNSIKINQCYQSLTDLHKSINQVHEKATSAYTKCRKYQNKLNVNKYSYNNSINNHRNNILTRNKISGYRGYYRGDNLSSTCSISLSDLSTLRSTILGNESSRSYLGLESDHPCLEIDSSDDIIIPSSDFYMVNCSYDEDFLENDRISVAESHLGIFPEKNHQLPDISPFIPDAER